MKLDVRSKARALSEQGNMDASWRGSRRETRQGIALVITLILLAVITFMAVTFLVVSHSQRAAVSTKTDEALAKGASETGVEMAKAHLMALITGFTNANNYGEIVSTNFIRSGGFVPNNNWPTNVSYVDAAGNPITGNNA